MQIFYYGEPSTLHGGIYSEALMAGRRRCDDCRRDCNYDDCIPFCPCDEDDCDCHLPYDD